MQIKQAPTPNDRLTPQSEMTPEAAARYVLNLEHSNIPNGLREQYTKEVEHCLDDIKPTQTPEKESNNLNDFKNDPSYNKKLKSELKPTPEKQLKNARDYEPQPSLVNNKNDLKHLNEAVKGVIKDLKNEKITPQEFAKLLKNKIEGIKNKDKKSEITLESTTSGHSIQQRYDRQKGGYVVIKNSVDQKPLSTRKYTANAIVAGALKPGVAATAPKPKMSAPASKPTSATAQPPSWTRNKIENKLAEQQQQNQNQKSTLPNPFSITPKPQGAKTQ